MTCQSSFTYVQLISLHADQKIKSLTSKNRSLTRPHTHTRIHKLNPIHRHPDNKKNTHFGFFFLSHHLASCVSLCVASCVYAQCLIHAYA